MHVALDVHAAFRTIFNTKQKKSPAPKTSSRVHAITRMCGKGRQHCARAPHVTRGPLT